MRNSVVMQVITGIFAIVIFYAFVGFDLLLWIVFAVIFAIAIAGSKHPAASSKLAGYWGLCIVAVNALWWLGFGFGFGGQIYPMYGAYGLMVLVPIITIYKSISYLRLQRRNEIKVKSD